MSSGRRDGWVVRTPGGPLAAERVVIATGLSNVLVHPRLAGRRRRRDHPFRGVPQRLPVSGRRVLVVGSGNSGAEIAVDLAEGGASEVLLSVRTSPGIVRRDTLGVPSQLLGIASTHLPTGVADRIAAGIRRVAIPDLAPQGLPAPERPYSAFLERRVIPIVDVGLAAAVKAGTRSASSPLSWASKAARRCSTTAAGSRSDAVIAATGFRTGLEPLVGHLGVLDERGRPLVRDVEEPAGAPGLHFVGYEVTLGGTLRRAGIEAKQLARAVAAGRAPEAA